ncbi:MAG TPA: PAS domain S-box protein, partial [Blastocatellia bacterium]|nr:PAS domain S-box protein [Blastocatellia bacterium]
GSSFFPLVLAEADRERIRQKILSLTPDHPVATDAHECISTDGEIYMQEWTDRGIFDAQGRLVELQSTGRDITERRRAEDALIGIALLDEEGHSVQSNPALQQMLGYTGDELRKMPCTEFTHPEDVNKDDYLYDELVKGQRSYYQIEKRYIRKDGQVVWGNLTVSTLNHQRTEQKLFIGMLEDITERKRAEDENHKLLHDLGERVKELTALHAASRILQQEWTDTAKMLSDLAALLPSAFQYPKISAARIRIGSVEAVTPGFNDSQPVLRADFITAGAETGSIEVVYSAACPPEFEGPFLREERSLINTLADMLQTAYDHHEAEAALRESEGRFRQLTENIREVFWMNKLDYSELLYISPAYETVWGRTRESLYENSRSFLDAIHPDDRVRAKTIIEQGGMSGFELQYRIVRPDGSIRWIWDRGFPVKNDAGQVYCIAGIAEDITERKRAEEQLKATSEQLRALMARLRSAKEEEGIRIAREIHDELGSALTSLRWDLEEIDRTLTETPSQQPASMVHEKIEGMLELINDTVNAIRRISSELRPGVLDDLGLVEAIEWQAQQFQARTGIKCHYDSLVENTHFDHEQSTAIFRIFQEALTNVLRHAQATEVSIKLEVTEGELVLTIADNGRGISESEKLGLHSLGLLGMQERAHLIGGTVEIAGGEGMGTTVTLRAPVLAQAGY